MTGAGATYRAFGVSLESDQSWPGWSPAQGGSDPAVTFSRADTELPVDTAARVLWRTSIDGRTVTLVRQEDGGHVLDYGTDARFSISPDRSRVLCRVATPDDLAWKRFMFDTLLWVVSHLHGRVLLHGGGIEMHGRTVALLAGTGAGKTSLAAVLIARGHALVTDDVLALDPHADIVHPGPPLMNVPRGGATDPADLGTDLGLSGDEAWVAVDRTADHPSPMGAVVFLRRDLGVQTVLREESATVLDLLPHVIGFERGEDDARIRFEKLGRIAGTVPILTLASNSEAAPGELADVMEQGVGDLANQP